MTDRSSPAPMSQAVGSPGAPLKALKATMELITQAVEVFCAVLLAVMTLIIVWQVVSRLNWVSVNAPWTEEIALMMLVWFGMAGAAVGIRKGTHIGVGFLVALFPAWMRKALSILTGLAVLMFAAFLLTEGIALARGCWTDQLSATQLPRGICVYLAVPVSAFLMVLYALEQIIHQLTSGGDADGL